MMWALVCEGKVVQVEASKFDVHPSLEWVDLGSNSEGVAPGWSYDGSAFAPPPAEPPSTVISYAEFEARFTPGEFDAATDFVFETDPATGKPARRALIQALQRAVARNSVDLASPRTAAFLDALVAAGILTAARKTEILTP